MKQVTVITKTGQVVVRLNNAAPDAPLTPELARRAACIAYGHAATCLVVGDDIAYRVAGHGVNVRRADWGE